jgi:hypothetical protein
MQTECMLDNEFDDEFDDEFFHDMDQDVPEISDKTHICRLYFADETPYYLEGSSEAIHVEVFEKKPGMRYNRKGRVVQWLTISEAAEAIAQTINSIREMEEERPISSIVDVPLELRRAVLDRL